MATSKELFDKQFRTALLRQVTSFKFEVFESATEDSVKQFKNNLKQDEQRLKELGHNMPNVNENDYHNITKDEWEVIEAYSDIFMRVDFTKEYLLSLLEMNVVYLFKNLELMMKKFIKIAYPNSNTKDLYQWENMKTFFRSNDIDLVKLEGYDECIELRKVNNAIKHNGDVSDDIKRIKGFETETALNHVNLETFYKRVRPKVDRFSQELGGKLEENLFDFPSERLRSMADELAERMDAVTLNAFIVRLQEKLSPEESDKISGGMDDLPF